MQTKQENQEQPLISYNFPMMFLGIPGDPWDPCQQKTLREPLGSLEQTFSI